MTRYVLELPKTLPAFRTHLQTVIGNIAALATLSPPHTITIDTRTHVEVLAACCHAALWCINDSAGDALGYIHQAIQLLEAPPTSLKAQEPVFVDSEEILTQLNLVFDDGRGGYEALIEDLVEWEFQAVSMRAERGGLDNEERCLLEQMRALRACYEAAFGEWFARHLRVPLAGYQIHVWRAFQRHI